MSTITELEQIPIMYIVAGEFSPADAFRKLEKLVPQDGREFYGTYHPMTDEYRACVVMKDGDEPEKLGLEKSFIDSGRYACKTLKGKYKDIVQKISPTFEDLSKRYNADHRRPTVEYYKHSDEFVLYLPILDY